jgi:D-sedoheptulose 7-phosphate isomerase
MKNGHAAIDSYLSRLQAVLTRVNVGEIEALAGLLRKAYDEGRTIFIMGNGGSGATASHIACDLNKGACFNASKKFRVMALTDNMPTLLALANDVGYESVFVEQLKCFLRPGDLVVAISGSGNSKNVLAAVEYANAHGGATVGLTGFDGGRLKKLAKASVHVNADDMQIVEDLHLIIGHILMQALSVS